MREVVRSAEGKAPPPDELKEWWLCEELHVLPEAGGLRDQPAGLMNRLRYYGHVYKAMKAWNSREPGKEKDFTDRYPEYWRIVQLVLDMEKTWAEAQ